MSSLDSKEDLILRIKQLESSVEALRTEKKAIKKTYQKAKANKTQAEIELKDAHDRILELEKQITRASLEHSNSLDNKTIKNDDIEEIRGLLQAKEQMLKAVMENEDVNHEKLLQKSKEIQKIKNDHEKEILSLNSEMKHLKSELQKKDSSLSDAKAIIEANRLENEKLFVEMENIQTEKLDWNHKHDSLKVS